MPCFSRGPTLSSGDEPPPRPVAPHSDPRSGLAPEAFVDDLRRDLAHCGPDFFARLREGEPAAYLRLVMRYVAAPDAKAGRLGTLTNAQLSALIEDALQRLDLPAGSTASNPPPATPALEADDAGR